MGALPKEEEKRSFTYSDYKDWELAVGERYELIYGEAFAMAGPNTRHQVLIRELFGQFYVYLQGKPCQVFVSPYDVRLFYEDDESDDTVVQPDIMVVCDKNKIGPEGCRGAPDLVIEILSPSNTAIEMERKFSLYQEAGVREYWIVDSKNDIIRVHCFRDSAVFTKTYKSPDAVPVAVLPGFSIELENVFKE